MFSHSTEKGFLRLSLSRAGIHATVQLSSDLCVRCYCDEGVHFTWWYKVTLE